jgi:hypothetical protein
MKIIISESQLELFIYKYLDTKDLKLLKTSVNYNFYISDDLRGSRQFLISCDMDGNCFISSILAGDVCSLFSLHPDNALSIISDWVENKLGVEVTYYYSDFGAD